MGDTIFTEIPLFLGKLTKTGKVKAFIDVKSWATCVKTEQAKGTT